MRLALSLLWNFVRVYPRGVLRHTRSKENHAKQSAYPAPLRKPLSFSSAQLGTKNAGLLAAVQACVNAYA